MPYPGCYGNLVKTFLNPIVDNSNPSSQQGGDVLQPFLLSACDDIIKLFNLAEKYPQSNYGFEDLIADNGVYSINANDMIGDAVAAQGVDRCKVIFEITNSQEGRVGFT